MSLVLEPEIPGAVAPRLASSIVSAAPVRPRPLTGGTAVVYCEANFGAIDGKTANGLVRHSDHYEILSVIDSRQAGLDSGMVLDGIPNAIPICADLDAAVSLAGGVPDVFIFGVAPSSGML